MLHTFEDLIRSLADMESFDPQDLLSKAIGSEQELDEMNLDWVAAAGSANPYQLFLERYGHQDKS